jgi:hypothetical protein
MSPGKTSVSMAASPSPSSATFPVDQAPTLSLAGETSPDESDTDPGDPPDEPDEFVGGYPEQRLPTPDQGPQPGVGRALVGLTPGQRSDRGPAAGVVALVGAPATRRDHRHELGWRDHADRNMAVLMDPDGLSPAPSPMLTRTLRVAAAVALRGTAARPVRGPRTSSGLARFVDTASTARSWAPV